MSLTLPAAGGSQTQLLAAPQGTIEALLTRPGAAPWGGCVICHPHPLYGGAMSNKVVYTLASTAAKAGLATLRFNFRGVGNSTGAHAAGVGETDDTVWLAAQLRAALPSGASLLMAGFSFGAFVALKAAPRVGAAALMTVAPPFASTRAIYVDGEGEPQAPGCPWAAIHSRDDEVVSYDETSAVLQRYAPAPRLVTVDGAGHFFHGRLQEVEHVFSQLIAEIAPSR